MSNVNNEENILARNFTPGALFRFAFPTMIMMMFVGLYQAVDILFVSNFIHIDGMSAINVVSPAIGLLWGLGNMFAAGGSAVLAKKMGEGREEEARRNFTAIVIAGVLIGALIALLGWMFMDEIIFALGGTERLLPYARRYLGICILFAPAILIQVLFQSLFVTAGKPSLGLFVMIASGITNIVLDYCFIVLFHWGMAGTALATGLGYCVSTIAGLALFIRPKGILYFTKPNIKLKEFLYCCYNGCSEMVHELAMGMTIFMYNITMMRIAGENGIAAITVMIYAQYLFVGLLMGFSMGVAPVISYKYGAGDKRELGRIVKLCLIFVGCIALVLFSIFFFGAQTITGLFTPKGSEVYQIASAGIPIFSFMFLFNGIGIFSSGLFTALSNGKISAVLTFTRTFVFLVILLFTLPRIWGITGVWLAPPLAEFLSAVFSLGMILKYKAYYFGAGKQKLELE